MTIEIILRLQRIIFSRVRKGFGTDVGIRSNFTPEMDCDQPVRGLPLVMSAINSHSEINKFFIHFFFSFYYIKTIKILNTYTHDYLVHSKHL
jgi:hypothetical protein